jgi:hypothetical protein
MAKVFVTSSQDQEEGDTAKKKNCIKWLHGPNISVAQLTFFFYIYYEWV